MEINVAPNPSIPLTNNSGQTNNPWFTVSNQFIPRNLHDVIRWARYITLHSPTTSEVVRKFATYPITDFSFNTKSEEVKTKYKKLVKSLRLKEVLQDVGFEYYTIANVFISIYFPIQRQLKCTSCGTEYSAKKAEWVSFKQYKYMGACPHCGHTGELERKDSKSFNMDDMNLIKWNPEHISVNHNPITGEFEYYYRIPNVVKQKVQKGDKLFVNTLPWGFIEAIRNNQDFKFDYSNIFHLRNMATGGVVEGLPVPSLLSLFNIIFYQATLRKANEAIATEFLSPMRVVFPSASNNTDPVVAMSLRNFVGNMENAIKKHKADPNHVLVAPVPVGYSPIGGEGRNLLVSQEIQQAEETILLALGVSRELLSGTTNWTSSSIGLRMMENQLFSYTSRIQDLITWVIQRASAYLGIEYVETSLLPFKLLDDEVVKQLLVNTTTAGFTSQTTLFEELGVDYSTELKNKKEEAVLKARLDMETKYEVDQATFLAAKDLGNVSSGNDDYKTILEKAQSIAEQLYSADEGTKRTFLNRLKLSDYTQYLLVSKLLEEAASSEQHQQENENGVAQVANDQAQQGNLNTDQSQDQPQAQSNQGQ
jgi:hypothetical protein